MNETPDYNTDIYYSGVFRATIGFSAPHFQPPRASFFLAKFTESYFFRHYTIMTAFKSSLSQEPVLGAHGNVILVSRCKAGSWVQKTYVWSHMAQRPWGTDVPRQCAKCGCLRPWKTPTQHKQVIKIQCSICGATQTFEKPEAFILEGGMGTAGQGQWCYVHRQLAKDDSSE